MDRPSLFMFLGGGALALYGVIRALRGGGMGKQPTGPAGAAPSGSGRVTVQRETLIGPTRRYRLTDTDILWLARALVGETGGTDRRAMAAVVWTLAQNFLLIRRATTFETFSTLIRAYSQPVSAAWVNPQSDKCRRSPDACSPARIARRQRIQAMGWAEIPEAVRVVVGAFRRGLLENPVPGAVDFASYRFPGDRVNIGGNWFGVGASRRLV